MPRRRGSITDTFVRSIDFSSDRRPRNRTEVAEAANGGARHRKELWNRSNFRHAHTVSRTQCRASSSAGANDLGLLFARAGLRTSSNFMICRARRGRAHHRSRVSKRLPTSVGWLAEYGGYWHRAATSLTTLPRRRRRRRSRCSILLLRPKISITSLGKAYLGQPAPLSRPSSDSPLPILAAADRFSLFTSRATRRRVFFCFFSTPFSNETQRRTATKLDSSIPVCRTSPKPLYIRGFSPITLCKHKHTSITIRAESRTRYALPRRHKSR